MTTLRNNTDRFFSVQLSHAQERRGLLVVPRRQRIVRKDKDGERSVAYEPGVVEVPAEALPAVHAALAGSLAPFVARGELEVLALEATPAQPEAADSRPRSRSASA